MQVADKDIVDAARFDIEAKHLLLCAFAAINQV